MKCFYSYFSGDKLSRDHDSVRSIMGLWLVKEIELFEKPFIFLIITLSQPAKSLASSSYSEQKYIITNWRLRSASLYTVLR